MKAPISIDGARHLGKIAEFSKNELGDHPGVVAFFPDGKQLACSMGYGTRGGIVVYDYSRGIVTRKLPKIHTKYSTVHRLELDSVGKHLVYTDDVGLYVWDVINLDLVMNLPLNEVVAPEVSPQFLRGEDGEKLYVAHPYESVKVIETTGWRVETEFPIPSNCVGIHCISPKADRVATYYYAYTGEHGGESSVTLWTLRTCRVEWTQPIDFATPRVGICFHPSGDLLAIGGEERIIVWRMSKGEIVSELRTSRGSHVTSLAFSPDGQVIASSLKWYELEPAPDEDGMNYNGIEVHSSFLWDWEWGAPLAQIPGIGNSLSFSKDGCLLAVSGGRRVEIWGVVGEVFPTRANGWIIAGDPPEWDNQGNPIGHPNYGDDW